MSPETAPTVEHERVISRHFTEDSDRWVNEYQRDDYHSRRYRIRAAIASRMLAEHGVRLGRLLDLGTGAGLQAVAAHRAGWAVVGIDLTPQMIEEAAANQGPDWLVASGSGIPIRSGSLDAVLMLGVIGYTPTPLDVLTEVRRVLDPNGILVISWHNRRSVLALATAATKAMPKRALRLTGRRPYRPGGAPSFYSTHNQDWSYSQFIDLLGQAGFTVIDHDGVDHGRFRPFGLRIWGDRFDIALSAAIEAVAGLRPFRRLARASFTQVVTAHPRL